MERDKIMIDLKKPSIYVIALSLLIGFFVFKNLPSKPDVTTQCVKLVQCAQDGVPEDLARLMCTDPGSIKALEDVLKMQGYTIESALKECETARGKQAN